MRNLEYMVAGLENSQVEQLLDRLRFCSGLTVIAGVGQNSLLAGKVASTFSSLSLRCTSVDAVALLHGNLGLLRPEDQLILLSNSGETAELLHLAEVCRATGIKNTIAIHSSPGCTLASLCTAHIHVPTIGEADHLGLVPSASSACFLVFLQSVGIQLASESGLETDDFLRTHPGGALGQLHQRTPD